MSDLSKVVGLLLSDAQEYETYAKKNREAAQMHIQERIYPELQQFLLPNFNLEGFDVSINDGQVEILLEPPTYSIEYEGRKIAPCVISSRHDCQRLNHRSRNLFDEIGGRYGVRILGFGRRDWESGWDWIGPEFKGLTLAEVLWPEYLTLSEVLGTE